jgi:ribosomal protein L10
MSKVIKQMQMDALKATFGGVRDLVVLSIKGLSATSETQFRAAMRKKNIRLQVVKNAFTRRVFSELGLNIPDDSPFWSGNTTLVWGANSIAELSRGIEAELKDIKKAAQYKDKVAIKGAVADGQVITFDLAKTMPTREEAIARVVSLMLSPASSLVSAMKGPAAGVAGQVKTVSEKKEEGAQAAEPAPAPTPA